MQNTKFCFSQYMLLGTELKFLDFGLQMPQQIIVPILNGLSKTAWVITDAKYKYCDKRKKCYHPHLETYRINQNHDSYNATNCLLQDWVIILTDNYQLPVHVGSCIILTQPTQLTTIKQGAVVVVTNGCCQIK